MYSRCIATPTDPRAMGFLKGCVAQSDPRAGRGEGGGRREQGGDPKWINHPHPQRHSPIAVRRLILGPSSNDTG